MKISPFTPKDIAFLSFVQPANWQDITPNFKFYISQNFCFPLKAVVDDQLVGVGSLILNKKTSWLAHIIVHPDYQRRGIGYRITKTLVEIAQSKGCPTMSLLATEFGQPVYEKLGFVPEIKYRFYKGGRLNNFESTGLKPYQPGNYNAILDLDFQVSGEDRKDLLDLYLSNSTVFVKNKEIIGYFLRDLGEGPVYANSFEGGMELLKYRCQGTENRVIVPEKNDKIISFLVDNGYQEFSSCFRMVLGDKLKWDPQMVFNRIGGYLG